MIQDQGDIELSECDDANIPVNIRLSEIDEEEDNYQEGYRFSLTADNYCPRKAGVFPESYNVLSDNKKELQEICRKYILPLYEIALKKINGIIDGSNDNLYYWM